MLGDLGKRGNSRLRRRSEDCVVRRAWEHAMEMMGHKDVRTTMIYLHVMNNSGLAVRSPVDALG